jgi:hypothetical protein
VYPLNDGRSSDQRYRRRDGWRRPVNCPRQRSMMA